MSWPRYEPAGPRCTNRVQPGAQELMNWVLIEFGRGARNGGIYNCRTVRGSANRSLHGEGRAIDASFPVIGGRANANGHALLNVLLRHRMALGVQLIIWDRRIWSASSPNGRRYTGQSPHIDHLHIELTWHAARTLTRTRVRQVVAGHVGAPAVPRPTPTPAPTPAPPPEPDPEEDEDMAVVIRHHDSKTRLHRGSIYSDLTSGPTHQANLDRIRYWTFLSGRAALDLSKDAAASQRWLDAGIEVALLKGTAMNAQAAANK